MDHSWGYLSFYCCFAKGTTMSPFVFAAEASPEELLIAGLVSGSGLIALIIKFLLAAPGRETSVYKQGVSDERERYEDQINELKNVVAEQSKEILKLRNGLVRLAVATVLSAEQKQEIAKILGFTSTRQMLKSEIEND